MAWRDWIRTVEIEPCLNAGDFSILDRQVEALLRTGCRLFHLDVADGEHVGPGTIGSVMVDVIVPLIRRYGGVLDVHLNGLDPSRHFAAVAAAGGDSVTFPYEGGAIAASIREAREHGLQVGVAFNPVSEPEEVAVEAREADLILCRAHAALGGEDRSMPVETIPRLRRLVRALPSAVRVQVEGGVGHDDLLDLYGAGAKVFVVGEPIYEREDLPRAYRRLVQALA